MAPVAPGSIPMKRVSAPEQTRERLRALIDGRLGTAPDRSNLVLLAAQLIVEEALEGGVRDALGRERYERAPRAKRGAIATATGGPDEDGGRDGRVLRAAGARHAGAVRLGDPGEPGGRTEALEELAVELYARGLSTRDIEDAFTRRERPPAACRARR